MSILCVVAEGVSVMWIISAEQAAEMYARFCRARYGTAKAKAIVEMRAAELCAKGDTEGERVWKQVGRALTAKH
jgi:hypothetical protein